MKTFILSLFRNDIFVVFFLATLAIVACYYFSRNQQITYYNTVTASDIIIEPEIHPVNILPDPPIKRTPIYADECFLDDSQLEVVRFSYNYGNQYDLGYTLAAIAIKESNAGKWKIGLDGPSGGLYHVTVDKAIRYFGWSNTLFNKNRAIQSLVDDDALSAELAIREIVYWRERNSTSWLNTWASYNAGSLGKHTERGQEYANDIRDNIAKIKTCGWLGEIK